MAGGVLFLLVGTSKQVLPRQVSWCMVWQANPVCGRVSLTTKRRGSPAGGGLAGADVGGGPGQQGGGAGIGLHQVQGLQGAGDGRGSGLSHGFLLAGDLAMKPRDLWA